MKKYIKIAVCLFGAIVLAIAGFLLFAQHDRGLMPGPRNVITNLPSVDTIPSNPDRNAYFGELHSHTSYSLDANIFGTQLGPREAYRFAEGEAMPVGRTGITQKITVPLDFAAVTDHAEGLGLMSQCYNPQSGVYWAVDCVAVRYKILAIFPRFVKALTQDGTHKADYISGPCGVSGQACRHAAVSLWEDIQNAANEYYKPGKFTTLIGFEYSPTLKASGMMHRNVIFRNANVPKNVFSASDGFVEDLMRWLDHECTGDCKALTIPHNPNFSWGLMFSDYNSDSRPATKQDMLLRSKYERLVEIFQVKGSSECAKGLMNNDEECGFENLFPVCTPEQEKLSEDSKQHSPHCVSSNDMVRTVLRKGLLDEHKWGFNPFKLGIVASTDNHNGLSGDTSEKTYKGHSAPSDSSPESRLGIKRSMVADSLGFSLSALNPGGLAGVWAEKNTRESIWDALYRKETWGTSGTRIKVRFFGGYDLPSDLNTRADMISIAYKSAVPMGGDLAINQDGKAPSFLVWASRDVNSAPLQKIQIVKGWVEGGSTKEQVFDVVCSDGIKPDVVTHHCVDNDAKVDLKDCTISENKGAAELSAIWQDSEFDSKAPAFYYVRVLENPVCRYTQRDSIEANLPHPVNVPQTIRERAWTSPIWYRSKG